MSLNEKNIQDAKMMVSEIMTDLVSAEMQISLGKPITVYKNLKYNMDRLMTTIFFNYLEDQKQGGEDEVQN